MRRLGLVLVAVGAASVVASLVLLPYIASKTLWDLTTRIPLIITIVAALGGLMAIAAIFLDAWLLPVLATGAGFFLFGELFPLDPPSGYSIYKPGFWLGIAGAVVMSVAGVTALVGVRQELELDTLGGGSAGASAAFPSPATTSPATNPASATSSGRTAPVVATAFAPLAPSPMPATNSGGAATTTTIEATSFEPQLPPAGWYADPAGQARERYWSGSEWTRQLR
jgi:hypothetical protein